MTPFKVKNYQKHCSDKNSVKNEIIVFFFSLLPITIFEVDFGVGIANVKKEDYKIPDKMPRENFQR